ncbi:hypothetical protein [Ensifer sp. LCM 4579]|uniref:hypothetical protein n=1 Tax=Ensifer sp. LCM 4579 TaxID=1848292 RepID=UPI0008DAC0F4|nr:hypothetical protein [Ensifer sp. LCM 4579]OHV85627.1 hypothetical protein LCM4579_02320 [Ensifer sp. LCM 4579]
MEPARGIQQRILVADAAPQFTYKEAGEMFCLLTLGGDLVFGAELSENGSKQIDFAFLEFCRQAAGEGVHEFFPKYPWRFVEAQRSSGVRGGMDANRAGDPRSAAGDPDAIHIM